MKLHLATLLTLAGHATASFPSIDNVQLESVDLREMLGGFLQVNGERCSLSAEDAQTATNACLAAYQPALDALNTTAQECGSTVTQAIQAFNGGNIQVPEVDLGLFVNILKDTELQDLIFQGLGNDIIPNTMALLPCYGLDLNPLLEEIGFAALINPLLTGSAIERSDFDAAISLVLQMLEDLLGFVGGRLLEGVRDVVRRSRSLQDATCATPFSVDQYGFLELGFPFQGYMLMVDATAQECVCDALQVGVPQQGTEFVDVEMAKFVVANKDGLAKMYSDTMAILGRATQLLMDHEGIASMVCSFDMLQLQCIEDASSLDPVMELIKDVLFRGLSEECDATIPCTTKPFPVMSGALFGDEVVEAFMGMFDVIATMDLDESTAKLVNILTDTCRPSSATSSPTGSEMTSSPTSSEMTSSPTDSGMTPSPIAAGTEAPTTNGTSFTSVPTMVEVPTSSPTTSDGKDTGCASVAHGQTATVLIAGVLMSMLV